MNAKEFQNIIKQLSDNKISTLDLSINQSRKNEPEKLTGSQMKELSEALRKNTSLKSLSLARQQIGDEGMALLANAVQQHIALQDIDLKDNKIRNIAPLIKLLRTNRLKKLDISSLDFAYDEIDRVFVDITSLLDVLAENTSLQSLCLCSMHIGDEGAKLVAKVLRENSSLQTLEIYNCGLGSKGIETIAEALGFNTSLQRLDLSGNMYWEQGNTYAIDETAKLLSDALKHNTSLQELGISYMGISEDRKAEINERLKLNQKLKRQAGHWSGIGILTSAARVENLRLKELADQKGDQEALAKGLVSKKTGEEDSKTKIDAQKQGAEKSSEDPVSIARSVRPLISYIKAFAGFTSKAEEEMDVFQGKVKDSSSNEKSSADETSKVEKTSGDSEEPQDSASSKHKKKT